MRNTFFNNNSNNSNQHSLSSKSLRRNITTILPETIKSLEETQGLLERVINYYSGDNSPTLAT